MKNQYVKEMTDHLSDRADKEKARPMEKYMKNHFKFLGIKSPELNQLLKDFFKENGLPEPSIFKETVHELWQLPEREYQYAALRMIDKIKIDFEKEDIIFLEDLTTSKSWWDTVDHIAPNYIGMLFKKHPEMIKKYTTKWTASDNIWLQRTAVLFQLKYKQETDTEVLFDCIEKCMDSNEFFVRKAIGWALREYSKTNPDGVIQFVDNRSLSALSKREALKVLKKNAAEQA